MGNKRSSIKEGFNLLCELVVQISKGEYSYLLTEFSRLSLKDPLGIEFFW